MTPTCDLRTLGWTAAREAAFAPLAAKGLVAGRVALEHNHVFRVLTAGGERLAEAAGTLKHEAGARVDLPVVGDWVALRLDPKGGRSLIRRVLTRQSWFSRKVAGRTTEEQAVAANIDTVFVVFALDDRFTLRGIERYLVVACQSGASPVVVLNKADIAIDLAGREAATRAAAGGVPVVVTSVRSGAGLAALASYLSDGRTVAMIGPSGAGKSSLVNTIVGSEVLPTGDVRDWDARGRHTSVHRQLVVGAAGGIIIDTPGMRELQLWEPEGTAETFGDIAELSGSCRFRDCRHDQEPGCAVKAAVDAGTLGSDRYGSFLKLRREEAAIERQREVRAQQADKRHAKAQQRAYRAMLHERERQRR